jgi:hypothetical protein
MTDDEMKALWDKACELEAESKRLFALWRTEYAKGPCVKKDVEPAPGPAPYGYCPICYAPGDTRERRPFGNDTCVNGHVYPSAHALRVPSGRR